MESKADAPARETALFLARTFEIKVVSIFVKNLFFAYITHAQVPSSTFRLSLLIQIAGPTLVNIFKYNYIVSKLETLK